MGGKVSKAKRPKRRWIGLSFPSVIRSRSELAEVFESSSLSGIQVKLYDFYNADSEVLQQSRNHCQFSEDAGIAIICVLLRDYNNVRTILQSKNVDNLNSISSSGKIRLVRERMGLPKPQKR